MTPLCNLCFGGSRPGPATCPECGETRHGATPEMHPGDLGLILLQCPVALGFEGHDCNGPDCNCGSTIYTPDAWLRANNAAVLNFTAVKSVTP